MRQEAVLYAEILSRIIAAVIVRGYNATDATTRHLAKMVAQGIVKAALEEYPEPEPDTASETGGQST